MRTIQVEKCEYCPYRKVGMFTELIWCTAFEKQQHISSKVKTFPNICPLDKE